MSDKWEKSIERWIYYRLLSELSQIPLDDLFAEIWERAGHSKLTEQQVLNQFAKERKIKISKEFRRLSRIPRKLFNINEFLKVKLEYGYVSIYVNDVFFQTCKKIVLNIELSETKAYNSIDCIDQITQLTQLTQYNAIYVNSTKY